MKKFLLSATIFLITFLGTFFIIQSKNLSSPPDDGKFYFKIASLQKDQGFIHNYPWLYYTEYRENSPGLHFLFPLVLIPFVALFPLMTAYVFSSAFFLAVLAVLFWELLSSLGIKFKGLWLLIAFLGSQDFIFRHSLGRPITLSLILMLGIVYAVKTKSPWIVFILALLNVWMYDGYFISALLMFIFVFGLYLSERKFYAKELIGGVLGFIAGNIINPFFPENIKFLHTFVTVPFLNQTIQDSNEWMPYNLEHLFITNFILVLLWLGALSFVLWKGFKEKGIRGRNNVFIAYGLLSAFMLTLTLMHRRFIEYFPLFVILFFVTVFKSHLDKIKYADIAETFKKIWQFKLTLLITVGLVFFVLYHNLFNTAADLKNNDSKGQDYKRAALFLESNTDDKAIVFNVQWDQFVHLFYWDDRNFYVNGLDPGFLHDYSPELYKEWKEFYDDQVLTKSNEEALSVFRKFKAKYVFVEADRSPNVNNLMGSLVSSGAIKEVYSQGNMFIYEVN